MNKSQPISKPQHFAIIGAGFTGLSAGYDLVNAGHSVTILEADSNVGGLASAFDTNGEKLDRFYHHWFTNDIHVQDIIEELGLSSEVEFNSTNTGFYIANKIFKLSTPLDLLKFSPLSFIDRIRLGLLTIRARRVKNWACLEDETATDWLRKLGGENTYKIVWEPLLKGKFGPYAKKISAVWIWNKLKLRGGSRGKGGEEKLAYLKGSFSRLADALAREINNRGGIISCNSSVVSIEPQKAGRWSVSGDWGTIECDRVIATVAPPIVANMVESWSTPDYLEHLRRIDYLANVCLVLRLNKSLSSTYWLNVNDPNFPYVGVIEHTNFEHPDTYAGEHIAYLSRYLPHSHELYQMTDKEIYEYSLPHIKRLFPEFDEKWVNKYHIWREKWAQPIVEKHYSKLIPAQDGPLPGLHLCSMAQIYPEDRGTNYAIREGRKIASRFTDL